MNKYNLKDLRWALKKESIDNDKTSLDNYRAFITDAYVSQEDIDKMIGFIAALLVTGDNNLIKMAYYLSIHLSIITNDYVILRDMSERLGYYPVIALIDKITNEQNNKVDNINALSSKVLSSIYKNKYFRTEEQYYFDKRVMGQENVRAIAPTSYGKSQLMIRKCIEKYRSGDRVCLIIPTKSLLAQTVSEIAKEKGDRYNVVTHPDMMTATISSRPHISVLTQERLMSILASFPNISYDYVFVDEAHNLFDKDQRSLILARAIIILKTRSPNSHIDYYSPFIIYPEKSLDVIGINNDSIVSRIDEFVKVPQFFIWDEEDTSLSIYDQFIDIFFEFEKTGIDLFSTAINCSGNKNIIYANKPSDVEAIADILADRTSEILFCEESKAIIDEACNSLSTLVHGSYNLIKLLKHGIVISHGRMTDIVKGYVEYLFKTIPELKYMVTTSTLLEGVNIPADRIFIYDYSKGTNNLSISSFNNLIGRICRFSDVFATNNYDISLLTPRVYIMHNARFMRRGANSKNFIRSVAKGDIVQKEILLNPLLEEYNTKDKIERRIKETTILGNIDNGRCSLYERISKTQPVLAQTEFGRLCFKNGVNFFDIFSFETAISQKLDKIDKIKDVDTLVGVLVECILEPTFNIRSSGWAYMIFTNTTIRNRILDILRNRASNDYNFAKLIALDIGRWQKAININEECIIYVGKIGDCDKNGAKGQFNNYHLFSKSDRNIMASYAVSLEKENLDNIDYNLMPIIETLNGLQKIDGTLYKRLKYGTDNDFTIGLIRLGVDLSLATIIVENNYLLEMFEERDSVIKCINKEKLLSRMKENGLSRVYIKLADDLL